MNRQNMSADLFARIGDATVRTYQSDGSDGYHAGSFGVIVRDEARDWCGGDGGWSSPEQALARGREIARGWLDAEREVSR